MAEAYTSFQAGPVTSSLYLGNCLEVLQKVPSDSVDLIVTSPPYADQRKNTYGGIHPDNYVEWFMPIADQLLRVVKPSGSFILNIKEKVVDSERHTYVLELIIEMRRHGWLWTEEYMWHKKNCYPENGLIDSETLGNDSFSSTKPRSLRCTKKRSWFLWGIGQRPGLPHLARQISAETTQK